jgi:hypothetical protein
MEAASADAASGIIGSIPVEEFAVAACVEDAHAVAFPHHEHVIENQLIIFAIS